MIFLLNMDCSSINRLKLKDAFQDQKKFQDIKCDQDLLNELFEWTVRGSNNVKSQLALTIKDIEERCQRVGISLRDAVAVEAYAVFNRTVPNHHASQKNIAAKFSFETDGLTLNFENESDV